MLLTQIKRLTGKLVLKSGLHIGAGDTEMRIGGTGAPPETMTRKKSSPEPARPS